MHVKKLPLYAVLGLIIAIVLAACSPAAAAPPVQEVEPCPTLPAPEECLECEVPEIPACPAPVERPLEAQWKSSGHADSDAEAFVHWDGDDPAVVSESCAKCHSSYGYQDFLGADGSEAGVVSQAAALGSTVDCAACHNDATQTLASVVFPSGVEITGLGAEARCMQCHQGRASKVSVDGKIEAAGVTDMDAVSEDLGFTNIHYFAAAATQFGSQAMGGYQYEGKSYDPRFAHVDGVDTCIDCHDPHTLEVKVDSCVECHAGVASAEDLKDIRMMGSRADYDGDGDTAEGVYYEIEGLREVLYQAMQRYSAEVAGSTIGYEGHSYPYFFTDADGNGAIDEEEAVRDNSYAGWTGRLTKAAYNYQTSIKDPGAFAHGGKYIIELLFDSIADLNSALADPIDMSTARRLDAGHFASSTEAFRHWDEDGEVSSRCAKCHSDSGLPTYLEEGVTVSAEVSSGFSCTTCHDKTSEDFALHVVETVTFPSGAKADSGNAASNICLNCHQGRASGLSVDAAVAESGEDEVLEDQGFINVHYFAAGATLLGSEANGAYQYAGQEYAGQLEHIEGAQTCVECHDPHGLTADVDKCSTCHQTTDIRTIRMSQTDYDGDGDTTEGLAEEVATMEAALYAAMQDYAADVLGAPIAYDAGTYPHFLNDLNGNGTVDDDEGDRSNGYTSWTPRLLGAAYNYQFVHKDPGGFAHNSDYVLQVLYDSLQSLGDQVAVDVSAMTRP